MRRLIIILSMTAAASIFPAAMLTGSEIQPQMMGAAPAQKVPGTFSSAPQITKPPENTVDKQAAKGPTPVSIPLDSARDYKLYLKAGHRSDKWNGDIEPAFQAFDSGNMPTAQVFMNKAYESGCRDGLFLFRYGLYKEQQAEYLAAGDILDEASKGLNKSYPSHPFAKLVHEHAGRALFEADSHDKALPHLKAAVLLQPKNFTLNFILGQTLRIKGEPFEAKQYLEAALALPRPPGLDFDPTEALLVELLTVTCEYNEMAGCAQYSEAILKINPGNPIANRYRQKLQKIRMEQKQQEMIQNVIQ